jgi:hypothetical protein
MDVLFSEAGLIFWAFGALLTVGIVGQAILGALLWPYSFNKWSKFVGGIKVIGWKLGILLGFLPFFGQITIPFAAFTFLFMLIFARK